MFIFYDLIFLLVAIILLPKYLLKRKFRSAFLSRLGQLPEGLSLDRPIWIHAVSVGEVMAVRGLIDELRKAYPQKKFVISTVTATGNKIANSLAKPGDLVTYLPLDLSFIVKGLINKIDPIAFVVVETEIWPNLFSCLYKKGIPVVTVNGRISDSSFRGYSRIKFLLKPILNRVSVFCVQTTADAQRLKSLGVAEDKIRVTGNVKFDIRPYSGVDSSSVRKRLGITVGYKLLVAGSTHQGEEEIILAVYKQLLKVHPDLRLLLAPRHPERAQEVGRLVLSCGFEPVFISKLSQLPNTYRLPPVFILDTIGQLMDYYAAADIVFVGGSLIEKGGHNILEPASLNKPILFGPHMFNFREITELFLENKSAVMVRNGQELSGQLEVLLVDPFKREDLGSRSSRLLRQNQGATKRNLEFIKSALTINQDIKGKKG